MRSLEIEASRDNCGQVLEFLDTQLEEADCPMAIQVQLDIAVEEIFVNVASYAYGDETGMVTIESEITGDRPVLTIRFIDTGTPYDPTEREDPDIKIPVGQRQIGGLGVLIVKKTMDDMQYTYEDGKNILTLRKRLYKPEE